MSIRLAVLVSGGGTTLQNLIDRIHAGNLDASIELVISSRDGTGGLEKAQRAGIATSVVPMRSLSVEEASRAVFDRCREHRVDLVVLGGFLHRLEIPDDYMGRVINIHPSLIPVFAGKGFYGSKVHQAVLDRGMKISGCTVHFANNEYDDGPIILQRVVDVAEDDTSATLAARVFAAECEALPDAIRLFAQGRLQIEGRRVRVLE